MLSKVVAIPPNITDNLIEKINIGRLNIANKLQIPQSEIRFWGAIHGVKYIYYIFRHPYAERLLVSTDMSSWVEMPKVPMGTARALLRISLPFVGVPLARLSSVLPADEISNLISEWVWTLIAITSDETRVAELKAMDVIPWLPSKNDTTCEVPCQELLLHPWELSASSKVVPNINEESILEIHRLSALVHYIGFGSRERNQVSKIEEEMTYWGEGQLLHCV